MYITYHNSKIFCEVCGKGQPIVMLHGFTESSAIWQHFANSLSQSYTVVTIDLPGHGRSDCFGYVHSMEQMADLVNEVLLGMGIDSAVIIGHSMGGYVALAFAKMFPSKIKGLGLFHSTASADSEAARRNREIAIKAIRENHQGFLLNFVTDLFAPGNRAKYSGEINQLISTAIQMDKSGLIAALEGMKTRLDMVEFLSGITCPVMFIAGKGDTRIPIESLIHQFSQPKESYSLVLEDVGHMGYIEAREKTLDFVSFFVETCFKD